MAELKMTGIAKSYGDVSVLEDTNLDIKTGKLIVFVGPSGCGKSTLLRMVAGLEKITAGELEIDGVVVNNIPPAERGIAMVFQSYALYPHMTVRENMSFALKLAKKPKAEIEAAVAKAAKILQLEDYLDRLPKALSGGQRQRVATRIEIAQLKESMPESTMIYVTHDQVEAMTLATRIVVLANKGIAQVGTPLDLYERPENEFVARFIGSPAMNLWPGKIISTGPQTRVQLADGCEAISDVPTTEADMGLRVNVGVRPEDLRATEDMPVFTGTVDFTELLGELTQIYFDATSGDPVIAKLPGIVHGLRGQKIHLTAPADKVHLFANGRSLLYR